MADRLLAKSPRGVSDYVDAASENILASAWTEVIASCGKSGTAIMVNNGCAGSIRIGIGAAAAEVDSGVIAYGGPIGPIPFPISKGDRVSVKSVSGTLDIGVVEISVFG